MLKIVKKLTGENDKVFNALAVIGLLTVIGLVIAFIVLAFQNGIREW